MPWPPQPSEYLELVERVAELGGGSDEVELTVDAASADGVYHTFDLGGYSLVRATSTLLSADPDGEPYGGGVGEIVFDTEKIVRSDDEESSVSLGTWDVDNPFEYEGFDGPLPALSHEMFGQTARYVTFKMVIFEDFDGNSNYYAGVNNPTATWRVKVEYK